MSYSYVSYTGNGSLKQFVLPFPFLSQEHLKAYVSGVLKTLNVDFTVNEGTSTLTFTTAPASGASVVLQRVTPATEAGRLVAFQDGAGFNEAELELAAKQTLYIQQEANDAIALSIRAPYTEGALNPLPSASSRAGKFLEFDGSGQPIADRSIPDILSQVDAISEAVTEAEGSAAAAATSAAAAQASASAAATSATAADTRATDALAYKDSAQDWAFVAAGHAGSALTSANTATAAAVTAADDAAASFLATIGASLRPEVEAMLIAGTGVSFTLGGSGATRTLTINASGSGGDVVGPASATADALAVFDGTTGKLVKQVAAVTAASDVLTIGTRGVSNSVDCHVLVSRNVAADAAGNGHAFSDSSLINRAGTIGYNSYDARVDFGGSHSYDHYAAFQSAPTYASSGTITNVYGLYHRLDVDAGTVTNGYGVYVADTTGVGALTTQYGVYIPALAKGTANWGLYTLTRSYMGADLILGGNIVSNGGTGGYGAIRLQGNADTATWAEQRTASTTAASVLNQVRARGTITAPTAVQSGDRLGGLYWGGAYGSGTYYDTQASICCYANQAWALGSAGNYIAFETTPNSSTTRAERARLSAAGNLLVGVTADTGLNGSGGISIAGSSVFAGASVASTPGHKNTGAWFTGGTGTTTTPHFFIEPTGATTRTSWSTSGTAIGINAASGFGGRLIDVGVAGSSVTHVDSFGNLITTGAINGGAGTPTGAGISSTWSVSRTAWGLSGIILRTAGTVTDSSTAAAGTATNAVFNSFAQPTLAATNAGVVTTNAATVYVANAPAAGTNQTITNPYALWVDDGKSRLDGAVEVGSTIKYLTGYTVATLPAGSAGMTAYVTDATAPAYGSAVVGGGSTVIPVFHNGTAWVCH
jgi:hypothetical protein